MQLDLSLDASCWDCCEVLTMVSIGSVLGREDMTDTLQGVRRHTVSVKEAAVSNGVYQAGDVAFYVPRQRLSKALGEPKPGDLLIDDSNTRYTVLNPDFRKRDGRVSQTIKLQARNLSLAFGLVDLITIETPVRTLAADGAKVISEWKPRYSDLPARVQLLNAQQTEERGIRGGKGTYAVIIDRQIAVAISEDRVNWIRGRGVAAGREFVPSGATPVYLDIIGYHNPEMLSELPVLDCELRP